MEFSFFHFAQPANAWSEPGNVAFQTVAYSLNVWCADVTSLITASVQRCTGWHQTVSKLSSGSQKLAPEERISYRSLSLAGSAGGIKGSIGKAHVLHLLPKQCHGVLGKWSRRLPGPTRLEQGVLVEIVLYAMHGLLSSADFRSSAKPCLRDSGPPPLVASVSRESLDLCPCSSGTWPTARQPRRTPRLPESPPTLLGSAILSRNRLRFCD